MLPRKRRSRESLFPHFRLKGHDGLPHRRALSLFVCIAMQVHTLLAALERLAPATWAVYGSAQFRDAS